MTHAGRAISANSKRVEMSSNETRDRTTRGIEADFTGLEKLYGASIRTQGQEIRKKANRLKFKRFGDL